MGQIQILDEHMTNLIAAGEVIERAKSVVKELVENSIDAKATFIKISLENGGLSEIRVTDNGCGMDREDANMCFIPHATSKIKSQNDLFNIGTLGFRGEALASIVAVSSFNLKTSNDGYKGVMLSLKGGVPLSEATISHPRGTEITVRNLFYNTPARLQHMKSPNVELAYVTDFVSKMALCRPDISFLLTNNGKEIIHTSGDGNLLEVISEVYSTGIAKEMLEIFDNNGLFKLNGFISKISVTKSTKNNIILCINGRVVYNKNVISALLEGYGNLLMNGKYPIAVLNVEVDLGMVDVNVHPTKYEVRLSDEATLKEMITSITSKTLSSTDLSVNIEYDNTDIGISDFEEEMEENEEKKEENSIVYDKDIDIKTVINNLDSINLNSEEDDELDHLNDYIDTFNAPYEDEKEEENEELDLDSIPLEEENLTSFEEEDNEPLEEKEEKKEVVQEKFDFLNEENIIQKDEAGKLQKMYYIGQLFGTYILAQNEDTFYLIDQHAANERVNYEKILKEFKKENSASYDLLVPFSLEYSPSDFMLVKENIDVINKFGIEMDEFGSNTFVVRSIPIWFFRGKEKELSEEIINHIIHSSKSDDYTKIEFLRSVASTMACKKSIKGNEFHSSLEIEFLLDELAKCDNPFTCPHGRPIIVKVSRSDVEKWFKRIV